MKKNGLPQCQVMVQFAIILIAALLESCGSPCGRYEFGIESISTHEFMIYDNRIVGDSQYVFSKFKLGDSIKRFDTEGLPHYYFEQGNIRVLFTKIDSTKFGASYLYFDNDIADDAIQIMKKNFNARTKNDIQYIFPCAYNYYSKGNSNLWSLGGEKGGFSTFLHFNEDSLNYISFHW